MNNLDHHYTEWANNPSEDTLNNLLQAVTQALIGSTDDSTHVAQEVCCKVWNGLESFKRRTENSFRNWVSVLARYERLHLKSEKSNQLKHRQFFEDDPDDIEDGMTASEKFETVITMEELAREESLQAASKRTMLKALWLQEHPDPFISQYAEGVIDEKSNQQIAAEMGITMDALNSKLKRFRKKLRNSDNFRLVS